MPGYLPPYKAFCARFEKPIVQEDDQTAVRRLNQLTGPFILRRMKADVLKELPPKTENIYRIELETEQRKLYLAAVVDAREKLRAAKPEDKMAVFAVLMRLREICCDPHLIADNWEGGSAKLDACVELVSSAVEGGHRILLFSQFTSMLDLLAKRLDAEGISHFTLQGSTPKPVRAELVRRFNGGEVSVFLISLRAGGTGLNLTAADIVIHYDPWWNVAAQNQATDRAYRIGQQNPVQVYKLIAQDTIEEKIVALQQAKQSLAENGDRQRGWRHPVHEAGRAAGTVGGAGRMKFAMFARPVVTIYDLPETTKESDAGVVSTIGDEGLYGQVCQLRTEPGGVTADGITLPETMAEVVTFYGYHGYVFASELYFCSEKELRGYLSAELVLAGRATDVLTLPKVQASGWQSWNAARCCAVCRTRKRKPTRAGPRWGWWMAAAAMSGMWRWNRCAFR